MVAVPLAEQDRRLTRGLVGLGLGLLAVTVLRTGIWPMPNLTLSFLISQSPYANPFPESTLAHYLCWNYLGSYLAYLVGVSSLGQFFVLHLAFAVAGGAVFVHAAARRLPLAEARFALWTYAAFPVASTAYYWVGMDGLIHLLMVAGFALPARVGWGAVIGFLLGCQHFESGVVGYGALAAAVLLSRRLGLPPPVPFRWILAVLVGLLLGRAALTGWFHLHEFTIGAGRGDWAKVHQEELVNAVLRFPHLLVWGALGAGWLLLWKLWGVLNPKERWVVFLPLAGVMGLVPLVQDTTRVLAHASFPLLLACFLHSAPRLAAVARAGGRDLVIVALILPVVWVIGGDAEASTVWYGWNVLSHHLFGVPEIPDRWWDWPHQWNWPFR